MIILASQSVARKAMLAAAGVSFEAVAAHVDEEGVTRGAASGGGQPGEDRRCSGGTQSGEDFSPATGHAGAGRGFGGGDAMMAGLLAKPDTRPRAEDQLRTLSGTTHKLVSAAVVAQDGQPVWRIGGAARLTMRVLSQAFIKAYLDREGEEVLGCVGCYRIEGLGAQLFTRIDGDQFVIRGLPLLALLGWLRERGELVA